MSEIDLTSQEVQDAIASAVTEAVDGLKAKNTELLGKLKKAQAGSTIEPADLEAAERERDEWKAKAGEAGKALTKAQKELEASTKARDELNANFNNTLRDSQLTEALAKAGVTNAVHIKAAKALLRDSAQVVDDNGQRVVKVGDKALSEAITEWAGSDEGKHFVTAPDANGGGAQGARGSKTDTGKLPEPSDKAGRAAVFAERMSKAASE